MLKNKYAKFKIVCWFVFLTLHSLVFSLKHISNTKDEDETGYYLIPRWYVCIWFLPVYVALSVLIHVFEAAKTYFNNCFTYNKHWIGTEKRKLTFKEKIGLRYQLLN
jgi:hypothetical protein